MAKYTPRTRLRNPKNPITNATSPGINRANNIVTGNDQKGFQKNGTVHSASVCPAPPG